MLLKEAVASPLPTIFGIFAAFWVFVLLLLYFGVGALIKKAERQRGHGHDPHH